jgi:ABC-type multidrug transport system ATPase subunit
LDSKSSFEIIHYLKKLALEEKKVVICTIHVKNKKFFFFLNFFNYFFFSLRQNKKQQPSTQLFNLFDDLVLLSKGELAYGGPRKQAVRYFAENGSVVPESTNPSDFYLEAINYDFAEGEKKPKSVSDLIDNFPKSEILGRIDEHITFLGSNLFQSQLKDIPVKKYENSWFWQTYVLTQRGFMIALKNPVKKIFFFFFFFYFFLFFF